MQTGKTKWFDQTKGYGFIEPDEGGRDIFVHHTDLKASNLKTLEPNQAVSFVIDTSRGKPKAVNIKII